MKKITITNEDYSKDYLLHIAYRRGQWIMVYGSESSLDQVHEWLRGGVEAHMAILEGFRGCLSGPPIAITLCRGDITYFTLAPVPVDESGEDTGEDIGKENA